MPPGNGVCKSYELLHICMKHSVPVVIVPLEDEWGDPTVYSLPLTKPEVFDDPQLEWLYAEAVTGDVEVPGLLAAKMCKLVVDQHTSGMLDEDD